MKNYGIVPGPRREMGSETMRELEKAIMLNIIDENGWIILMPWISCVTGFRYGPTDRRTH